MIFLVKQLIIKYFDGDIIGRTLTVYFPDEYFIG